MKTIRLARPLLMAGLLLITNAHAQTYSRTEVIEYHDNLAQWVLGQTAKVTNANTGVVISETQYTSSAQPWKIYSYGKLQQTFGYNADGTLATVADGRNLTSTFSSWKRGIPQSIVHADTTTESAVVNDDGTIASAIDETGAKTCYGYDAMGRLASITYPSESQVGVCDTSTWAQTTQSFQQVFADEYGIPSGHWKQTITTGAGRKTTYYSARWQPLVTREEDLNNASAVRVSAWRYDAEGRVTDAYYPQDGGFTSHGQFTQGTHTTYDALGRVTHVRQDSELGVLTTTTEYLPGFKTRVTNPRGFATTQSYEVYDTPSYDAPVQIDAPGGAKTTIARDSLGKPTAITRTGPEG